MVERVKALLLQTHVWHREGHRRLLTRHERRRVLEGIAELPAEGLAAHQLLVAAHRHAALGTLARVVARVDINQLHDELRPTAAVSRLNRALLGLASISRQSRCLWSRRGGTL